jgi:acyl-CoA synthetase (NDP forming)
MQEAPSLELLFNPASILLVGASNTSGKMGNVFARRLKEGFDGSLYAVNPNEREVFGIQSYPSVPAVPGSIDLMIALLPGSALVDLMENCPPGKIKFLAAIPSGFSEVADGRILQKRLRSAAAACGVALIGPNIVGILNCERGLNASMMPILPPGGRGISGLTQSGGFGMALAMYASDHGVLVAKFCDLGNTGGVSVERMLSYYGEDPATRVVVLFLEAVGEPDAFVDILKKVARQKPIVLSAPGYSAVGRRASKAHLGLTSNMRRAVERLPRGVVHAATAEYALDASKALLWQRRAKGSRLGILTGTGGIGVELADLAAMRGLQIPKLSASLQTRLRAHLPRYAAAGNPIDATPIWWDYPKVYPALIRALDESEEVDLLLVSITDVPTTLPDLADAIAGMSPQLSKPMCVFWGSRNQDLGPMYRLQNAHVPCYRTTAAAVNAAAALVQSGRASAANAGLLWHF